MASPLNNMSGTLSVYTPTMRERVVNWFAQNWYGDTREGYDQANKLMNVLQFTPVGAGADIYDVGRAVGRGDYATAGLTAAMAGLPGPSPKGFRAFHGSPHSFDKFSTGKIGTGEGAQAYGHGLYFAENEDIARGYRDALKPGKGLGPEDTASRVLDVHGGDIDAAIASLTETINRAFTNNTPYEDIQRLMQAKNILNTAPEKAAGSMYEVNIAADPSAFLDWDKPLSEQPEVLAKIGKVDPNATGEKLYRAVTDRFDTVPAMNGFPALKGNPTEATRALKEAGIPGIKYLDAGSRGAGGGTRNYVVFDDRLISIVRKYGIAGASAYLGYNILDNVSEAQAEELRQIEKGTK